MFRITISWDDTAKQFIPELEQNKVSLKLDRREKVEIIDQCTQVIIKAIKSSPETKEED